MNQIPSILQYLDSYRMAGKLIVFTYKLKISKNFGVETDAFYTIKKLDNYCVQCYNVLVNISDKM